MRASSSSTRLPIERTELVSADDPAQALAALRADDDVVYAEPDRRVHAHELMDDPGFGSLWGLENTGQMDRRPDRHRRRRHRRRRRLGPEPGRGRDRRGRRHRHRAGHVDLADQIATNAAEAGGAPGVDDDGNGYVDDMQGWDFVGKRQRPAGRQRPRHPRVRHDRGRRRRTAPASSASRRWPRSSRCACSTTTARATYSDIADGVRLRGRHRRAGRQRLARRRLLARDRGRDRRAPEHALRRRGRQRRRGRRHATTTPTRARCRRRT